MAGAVAASALAVGADRAADSAARCLDADVLAGALQHLHRAALDPVLSRALRSHRALLNDVRPRAAQAKGISVPKLAEPRRVSWPTLIMVVGTLIGGWALIGVLIDVSKSFDTVLGANWLWVIAAFILAQLAFVASALEGIGSVAGALPFGEVIAVEVANSFSALAGGTAAVFATRVRFFQQQGYDATVALSSGAIMATSSWIAMGVLFLVSLPFAWGSIHLEATPESGGNSALVWIILAVVLAVGLLAGLALAVPRLRRLAADKLRPKVRDIWGNLRLVASSPRKLVFLVGGSFAQELVIAMALSVSLRAFDDHLRLPILIVVITLAGFIGGVSPTPGGMAEVVVAEDGKCRSDADRSPGAVGVADEPVGRDHPGSARGHVQLRPSSVWRPIEIDQEVVHLLSAPPDQLHDQELRVVSRETALGSGLVDCLGNPLPGEHDEAKRLEDPIDELLAEAGHAVGHATAAPNLARRRPRSPLVGPVAFARDGAGGGASASLRRPRDLRTLRGRRGPGAVR